MTKGSTIVDDRGKQVAAFSVRLHLIGLDARTIASDERELLAKVNLANAIRSDGSYTYAKWAGFIVGGAIVSMMLASRIWLPGLPTWQRVLLAAGVAYGVLVVIGLFVKNAGAIRVARTLVGNGRCGSCFYPLKSVEAANDGCVACPECGAAWKAEGVGALKGLEEVEEGSSPLQMHLFKLHLPVVEDDRGRLVFAANPKLEALEKRFEHREANEIALLVGEGGWIRRNVVTIVGIAMCGFALVMIASNQARMGLPANAMPIAKAFIALGLLFFFSSAWREYQRFGKRTDQESGRHILGRLLEAGRCATCAVRMDGMKPQTDGCRVCAKCGSAWKSLGR
jgi:hypothetical protein